MYGITITRSEELAVRTLTLTLALCAVMVTVGCTTDPTIRNLKPKPGMPHLSNLENHLTYEDPDAGESDYIPDR
jgi:hypothetical protein